MSHGPMKSPLNAGVDRDRGVDQTGYTQVSFPNIMRGMSEWICDTQKTLAFTQSFGSGVYHFLPIESFNIIR